MPPWRPDSWTAVCARLASCAIRLRRGNLAEFMGRLRLERGSGRDSDMRLTISFTIAIMLASCEERSEPCPVGQTGCECTAESLCIVGLSCVEGVCQTSSEDEESSSGNSSEESTGDTLNSDSSDSLDESSSDESSSDESDSSSSDDLCGPPEISCGDGCVNPFTDNENCGECDNACLVEGEHGNCVDGECAPTLSECFSWETPVPCEDVCSQMGMACLQQGCQNGTYLFYGALDTCDQHTPSGASINPCSEPSTPDNGYYRCCCAQ
jgi:hypothetical protein